MARLLANNGKYKKWKSEVYQQLSGDYQWLQTETLNIPYMNHWLQRDLWLQLVVDKIENAFTSRQDLPVDSEKKNLVQIQFLGYSIFGYSKSHFIQFFKAWIFQNTCFSCLFRFLILFATLQSHGVHYYPQGVCHLQVIGQQKFLDPIDDNWLAFVGAKTYLHIYI